MLRTLFALFACLVMCWTPLGADEDDDRIVQLRIPIPRPPETLVTDRAQIVVPTDFPREGEHSTRCLMVDLWSSDRYKFDEPLSDEFGLSMDAFVEIVGQWSPAIWEEDGREIMAAPGERMLYAQVAKSEVDALRKAVAWASKGAAPSVRVRATLATTQPEEAVRATGAAVLRPGRWTRVIFQRDLVPFVIDYEIEIAQESTAMNPISMELPQGQELYMRYHPGESVSLVELWSGSVEHTDVVALDLSVIRNVPEGNAPGPVALPRSNVQRARTALLVPNGRVQHTLRISQGGKSSTLTLDFDAPKGATTIASPKENKTLGMLRIGAIVDTLDFGSRHTMPERWMEMTMSRLFHSGFDEDTYAISVVSEISSAFLSGWGTGARAVQSVRDDIVAREKELRATDVGVRVLSVPEATYRRALRDGTLRLFDPVADTTLDALTAAGAAQTASMHMPVLVGVEAGFRVGASVPGFVDSDVEVAQQAAGLDPITAAAFAGILGDVRVDATDTGYALELDGSYAWASSTAGELELVFRPPVSMQFSRDRFLDEPDRRRRAKLPILGGGRARFVAEVDVGAADGTEYVLGAIAQGDEVALVLGSVRARR